ncbi:MAG: Polymorphic outer membrane protein [Candidatus Collierbacteria bacterium GW2011_GWD2_45_10]|nr:MAG: Polymorphic outer membrane protein [Candidatus Collierbacteria bacterium GW2011_GWA2_44_13]KKT63258.1 MAG: Polymorphic outer membrane protein [Candidatus Collierbacteria bacterium GW2011_GWD1_44_27]KKT65946.1 MAG: Polymorphic outer membrane protein [Candidatus Collierbacteria bacterium GW2011_GWC2_44_30]KKT89040.1 MAG: Polymorphic outer membrane protein [Candidatus Collierbacteria bacterium GW2011_GWD2_45_10]
MKTKMKSQNKKTLVSALLLLVSLALIFGVALLIKTGNFNDQGRASSGTIMVGQLIRSTDSSLCRKCIQQCPGLDNVLRDCNPMASYGISIDSICNQAGRVETCGNKAYCCPKPNSRWTTDLTKCPGVTPAVKPPSPYRLLKDGGVCTAMVISKTLAEPLVNKKVVATGTLKEPYFYASKLVENKCVEQCPGADKVLRNCTPPEADGTSQDSLCNATGRTASCGGIKFCCPRPGMQWTKDMTKCPIPTPTKTPTPTPTSSPTPTKTPTPTPSDNQPPQITTTSLPSGYANESYGASIDAIDPNLTDSLKMAISGLPFGLNSGPCAVPIGGGKITCYVSGTPASSGLYSVQVTVTDNRGATTTKSLALSILAVVSITPTP